jgi:hypothetical protein
MRWTRRVTLLVLLCYSLAVAGCASIMHGRFQTVAISSTPSGCALTIDEIPFGTTPVAVDLRRKGPREDTERADTHLPGTMHRQPVRNPKRKTHLIRLEMQGYEPFEVMLNRKVSGWVWGNIVFGGFIGWAIDAATGGLYRIEPDSVMATLAQKHHDELHPQENGVSLLHDEETIYVMVVLRADPSWQRIGELHRLARVAP